MRAQPMLGWQWRMPIVLVPVVMLVFNHLDYPFVGLALAALILVIIGGKIIRVRTT